LRDSRPASAADPNAGRAGPQHGDPRRGSRSQSAPARPRPPRSSTPCRAPGGLAAPRGAASRRCRARRGRGPRSRRRTVSPGRKAPDGQKRARQTGSASRRGRTGRRGEAGGRGRAGAGGRPFVVLTGLSGAGKSHAIRALEDLGYFCVDNLPTALIPTLAALALRGAVEKAAIVADVRERRFLASFPAVLRKLRRTRALRPLLIFLDS